MRVFSLMSTQWRTGYTGLTGLDYASLPIVEDAAGIAKEDREEIFWAVREMELEVLRIVAERIKANG